MEKHREPGGVHVNVRLPADLHPALVDLAPPRAQPAGEIVVALRAYAAAQPAPAPVESG